MRRQVIRGAIAAAVACFWLGRASAQDPGGAAGELSGQRVPLSQVVLYSSGVGYFQRDGVIEGGGQVQLEFKSDQMSDLLKSLIVQDFDGGYVRTVVYDAREPIARALKGFAVDLTGNPSMGQLLDQMRGQRVEVAAPGPTPGVVVGVERKKEQVGERQVAEVEYLNLLTTDGLRSIPLSQVQRVQLVSERLSAGLRQALDLLASSRDTQKKGVRVEFDGEGRRRVRIAYIVEAPVWKTSYRLVLREGGAAFLQGWAIVENTTDEDWDGVRLSLLSGRPISFSMDLYEPRYVTRPVVVPELHESLRPPVHADAMVEPQAAEAMRAAPPGLASRMMQPPAAGPVEIETHRGVLPAVRAAEAGELFQYAITAPVRLGRHRSAMVPIVGAEIGAVKTSIYNEQAHSKHPLNAIRLKNSTELHLMHGPITVFDGGVYAGDARIEHLAPGQERLISYALDLTSEVEPVASSGGDEQVVAVSIRKGTLLVTRKAVNEKTYHVRNRDQKTKVVMVEHPFRPDWRLVQPEVPGERTREAYRFAVTVGAAETARLSVREERPLQQIVRLIDAAPDTIALYLQAREVGAAVKEALQRVVALRNSLDLTAGNRSRLEQRIRDISQEQGRIRENMARISQTSDLYARYIRKLDQQETEIEQLRKEIDALKATEDRQRRELSDYLLELDIG
jgi:hypothetical protein